MTDRSQRGGGACIEDESYRDTIEQKGMSMIDDLDAAPFGLVANIPRCATVTASAHAVAIRLVYMGPFLLLAGSPFVVLATKDVPGASAGTTTESITGSFVDLGLLNRLVLGGWRRSSKMRAHLIVPASVADVGVVTQRQLLV